MTELIFASAGFAGRRALVTGASAGIGLATAQALIALGTTVLGTSRTDAGIARLRSAGIEAHFCDVGVGADRRRLVDAAGNVDFLVNAAGETTIRQLVEVTDGDWQDVLTANAASTFFMCQLVSERMFGGGAIVNVASAAGKAASTPEIAPYIAAKAAVIAQTRLFGLYLAGRNIRVNAVSPGIIDTPGQWRSVEAIAELRNQTVDQLNSERLAEVPLGRIGQPNEIASAILFLLSPGAGYITGQCLNVDGGLVTW